jgi:hypothetical protein
VTVVDWPVVHSWSVGDPDFVGAVTILDEGGAQLATAEWPAPTGRAADLSLQARVVPDWVVGGDWLGRRVTSVTRTTPGLPRQSHG